MTQEIPYGYWPSPVTAEWVSKGAAGYSYIEIVEDSIYWIESRPEEKGRCTLMCSTKELTPFPYNVRSSVHEYGGKPYAVHNGVIYFVDFNDQVLYMKKGDLITPLTDGTIRFAEPLVTEQGIIAVGERGQDNFLALIKQEETQVLASGYDFYGSPVLSPSGKKLAWMCWNHPNMPWNGTQVWTADFIEGKLSNPVCIAGGDDESIFQPQWSPGGVLHYVSDKSGWWNLYRSENGQNIPIYPLDAEFGQPLWVLGMSTYGFDGNNIIASYQKQGQWKLVKISSNGAEILFQSSQIQFLSIKQGIAAFVAGFANDSPKVVCLDLASNKTRLIGGFLDVDSAYISQGEPIVFPSLRKREAYAFYYPPKNKDCRAPVNAKPPLLVKVHGGPTAQATGAYNGAIQYWTSRGFAVVDVNYGGSSGYGRSYRDSLKMQWGVIDREDCEAAALHLVNNNFVDPSKIFIQGYSSGGYTVLAALTFGSVFAGGASYYGISDLSLLAKETHKFESRYMDQLIGPYPADQSIYEERSPLRHSDKLKVPVIFFQGEEDRVVPPNQARELFEVLKRRGVKAELVLYSGEQHGFRKAETIQDTLEKELAFYLDLFKG